MSHPSPSSSPSTATPPSPPRSLVLTDVCKRFGSTDTVRSVNLAVEPGEFVVFVGPSGCGKSTLLRMIAGLEPVTSGRIEIAGVDVTHAPPARRQVAMVFQSYALYPHMTVEDNLTFGMRMRGEPAAHIAEKTAMAVEMLRLAPYLKRKPGELSGGQCQRVAIGRALVQEPAIFLFDEPLSNLDAELRLATRVELAALHQRLGRTMIYVTHDQVEAMTLADKIVVLKDGRVEQVGAPLELYHHPANVFVAQFLGSPAMNILPASQVTRADRQLAISVPGGEPVRTLPARFAAEGPFRIGVRPAHWQLGTAGMAATVQVVERLGDTTFAYCEAAGQRICVELPADSRAGSGDLLRLDAQPAYAHVFNAAGETVIA